MKLRNVYSTRVTPRGTSKLPLKVAFKIGCSNFRHHRFRLFSTILLLVIAFSLLGVSLTVAFLDLTEVFCKGIILEDLEYIAIYKHHWYIRENGLDQTLDQFLEEDNRQHKEVSMSVEDAEFLKSQIGNSYTLVYTELVYSFQDCIAATLNQMNEARKQNPETCYGDHADGYIAITEEECERMGFTVIGELPKNTSEIAISECLFNIFAIKGLIEDSTIYELSSYEDIIGHKIPIDQTRTIPYDPDTLKTITGVVVTGCDRACYEWHNDPEDRSLGRNWETYHEKIFVSQDYFEEYSYVLCPIPQDKTELRKMVDFILEYEENAHTFRMENRISISLYHAYGLASMDKMLCLYLSIIFLFFAVMLLSNYILTSMRRQMKQIGILSALGAGFKDLCKVYGSAIGVMCAAIAAISLFAQLLCIDWYNEDLKNMYLTFDIIPFSLPATLVFILIMAVVAFASCFIPLIHLRKLEPTTIINKGQIK